MNCKWLITVTITALLFGGVNHVVGNTNHQIATEPMVVRYFEVDELRVIKAYHRELMHRALELTRSEYGDYQEVAYRSNITLQRRAVLIAEGKLLNLIWGPAGTPAAGSYGDSFIIPIDILHGLQGYRVCLINASSPLVFTNVDQNGLLSSLKLGQVDSWSDMAVYRSSNINLTTSDTLLSLFDMLGFKRINCIPLGINEITTSYNQQKARFPFLAIDDQLLIYYHYPIYFYVSKTQPELAKRIELGLHKMQQNGEFLQLFKQYHPQDLSALNLRSRKVICLKSPFITQSEQCVGPLKYPDE